MDMILIFIRSVVVLAFFLVILPMTYGMNYARSQHKVGIEGILYAWPVGYAIEFSMFGIICVFLKTLGMPFLAEISVSMVCLLMFFVISVYEIRTKVDKSIKRVKCVECLKEVIELIKKHPEILFLILIILLQFYRVVFCENGSFYDDKAYNVYVSNILNNDSLAYTDRTFFSSLYEFEAFIAYVSGLHLLIITNTIYRGFVILCFYSITYIVADELFQREIGKKIFFCLMWALLNEVTFESRLMHDSFILLRYPNWGKGMIVFFAPLFFILLYKVCKEKSSVIANIAVLAASTSLILSNSGGSSIVILILFGEILSDFIRRRKMGRIIRIGVLCLIPAALQILMYLWKFK